MKDQWVIKGEPRGPQLPALQECAGRKRYGYFLEMGLGKTALTLNDFMLRAMEEKTDKMVIICPNSLKRNWINEAKQWGLDKDFELVQWPWTPKTNKFIMAMNFEALIHSGGKFMQNLVNQEKIFLTVDESIHMKNPRAQRTKKLIALSDKAKFTRLLSGHPITKSPLDAWAQLMALDAEVNTNACAFRNKFCRMGGFKNKQVIGAKNEDQLHDLLHSVGFFAKKKDWTDLPEKIYMPPRRFVMNKEIQKKYDEMLNTFITYVGEEEISVQVIINMLNKLQQIASGFIYNDNKVAMTIIPYEENNKFKLLLEMLEETSNKAIIFAFFRPTIQNLKDLLDKKGISWACIAGGMKDDEIEKEKEKFNEGGAECMIAQTTAARYGHTLLGDQDNNHCDTVIFFENCYELDARIQAEDRPHRFGQHYPVTYQDFVGSPIEEKVIESLQFKKDLANSILEYVKKEY